MWLIYLGLAVAIIVISYGISMWSFSAFLEDQGFYLGEDGRYHCRWGDEDEDAVPPSFTYCLEGSVLEAFQVGSDVLPEWAVKTPTIDVVASEPRRVLLHRADNRVATIPEGEWIVKFPDGTVGVMHDDDMQKGLVKIKLEEECR